MRQIFVKFRIGSVFLKFVHTAKTGTIIAIGAAGMLPKGGMQGII